MIYQKGFTDGLQKAAVSGRTGGGDPLRIKIRIADPAGNITVFVTTPVDREKYPAIARQILARKELKGEQVGFIEKTEQGSFRMEMIGGEFCGNASRSFAYLLCQMAGKDRQELEVEVSGSPVPLKVIADRTEGTSQIDMPLPKSIELVQTGSKDVFHMVIFDGICHLIVPGKPRGKEFVENALARAREACPCGAWGIMFLEEDRMVPAVYVESTDSLIWESSCASGSMAAAVYLSREEKEGVFAYTLFQPGGRIRGEVRKKDGRILRCTLGGPVKISEEMEIELENGGVDII